jgi:hypothetical protein
MREFEPVPLLRVLDEFGVEYVVIGGVAANAHGSPSVTKDLDVCYARDRGNLERLAAALQRLGAKLRGVDDDVPFLLDAKTLRAGDSFTFTTTYGDLDVLATPSGTRGYDQLARAAEEADFGGFSVRIAALDDLIAMKRAANRLKDQVEVQILGALREEIEAEGR